jgi:hypothetical protein
MYRTFLGAFYGALVLPAVSSLFAIWFEPAVARDGQFIFLVLIALPVGAVLGVITALARSQTSQGEQRAARQVALAGGVAGFILGVASGLSVAILYSLGLAFWAITTWPRHHGAA